MISVTFDAEEAAGLFPAALCVDASGQINCVGPSLARISDESLLGRGFFDVATVERPIGIATVAALRDQRRQLIVRLHHGGRICRLRGVALARGDDVLLLLGHIPSLDGLDVGPPLKFGDFSPTDGTLDMLLAAEMRKTLLDESQALTTALEREKRVAERAMAARSEFLACMSHEIRTPMNGVLGMASLLATTELTEQQRRWLQVVSDSGASLMRILDDILDLSKIDAGRLHLEVTPIDIAGLAGSVRALHAATASRKQFDLHLTVRAPEGTRILGDPVRLRQILDNLVSNAVKFTESGSVAIDIAMDIRRAPALLMLEVRDSGIGMDEPTVRRLFEPFMQADTSTTRRFGGTGLGLAITKRLIDQMEGSITVGSSPGRGSAFTVTIPVALDAAEPIGLDAPAVAGRLAPEDLLVLLVEDNETSQIVLSAFLKKLGARCVVAADGQRALDALSAEQFDLVVMDLHMPLVDGFQALQALRRREGAAAARRVPVLALSADAAASTAAKALACGADEVLAKPIDLDRFGAALADLLGRQGKVGAARGAA